MWCIAWLSWGGEFVCQVLGLCSLSLAGDVMPYPLKHFKLSQWGPVSQWKDCRGHRGLTNIYSSQTQTSLFSPRTHNKMPGLDFEQLSVSSGEFECFLRAEIWSIRDCLLMISDCCSGWYDWRTDLVYTESMTTPDALRDLFVKILHSVERGERSGQTWLTLMDKFTQKLDMLWQTSLWDIWKIVGNLIPRMTRLQSYHSFLRSSIDLLKFFLWPKDHEINYTFPFPTFNGRESEC